MTANVEQVIHDLLRAERDAAVAAIERVRGLADQWNGTPDYLPSDYDKGRVDQRHAMTESLLAALDGAPEPEETEWVYRARNSILNSGAHVSEETARATLQLMIENHVFEVEPEPVIVERRPRDSWLPVEGEKP